MLWSWIFWPFASLVLNLAGGLVGYHMGTAKNRPMLGISLGLLVAYGLFFFAHIVFISQQGKGVDQPLSFYLWSILTFMPSFLLTLFYALVGYKLGLRLNAPRLGLAFALVFIGVYSFLWSILWTRVTIDIYTTLNVTQSVLLLLPPVLAVSGLIGYDMGLKKQKAWLGCAIVFFTSFAALFLFYTALAGAYFFTRVLASGIYFR